MRWTQDQFESYIASKGKWPGNTLEICPDKPDPGKESRLQAKCEAWMKERGFPCFHDRSRGKNRAGWFDLTCLLPEGRTVFIELKSGSGRPSPEQSNLIRQAKYLKHEVYEVRSFKRFIEIVTKQGVG